MEGVTWWVIQWQGRGSGSLEGSDSGGSLLGGRCLASHPLVLPCLASPHFRAPTVPPTPIPLTRVGAGDLGVALVGCPVPLPCPMLHHPVPKMSLWCSPGSPSQVTDTNTEPDLGTSLSLSLHPPCRSAGAPRPRAVRSAVSVCAQGGCCSAGGGGAGGGFALVGETPAAGNTGAESRAGAGAPKPSQGSTSLSWGPCPSWLVPPALDGAWRAGGATGGLQELRQAERNRQQTAGRQRQRLAGTAACKSPPCQLPALLPTASLATEVSQCLLLPRCQVSCKCCLARCPCTPGLGTWRKENPIPTRGPAGEPWCGAPQGCSPSARPTLTRLTLLPIFLRLLMARGGGRKNNQQTIAKIKSDFEQGGGHERRGVGGWRGRGMCVCVCCQIHQDSLETPTTMTGIFNHALLNPSQQRG